MLNKKEEMLYLVGLNHLMSLEEEGLNKRQDLLTYTLDALFNSPWIFQDEELNRRMTLLVDSSNLVGTCIENLSTTAMQEFQAQNPKILGRLYKSLLIINNIFLYQEEYISCLGEYETSKLFEKNLDNNFATASEIETEINTECHKLVKIKLPKSQK